MLLVPCHESCQKHLNKDKQSVIKTHKF